MKSSRRVFDDGVLEVAADPVSIGGDELHVIVGCGTQPRLCPHRHLRSDGLLEVGVEPLVGVELGAVAGQVEDLDVLLVLGQPSLHGLAVVHAQVVQDQKDLLAPTPAIAHQRLQELDETLVVERAVDDHPVGPPLLVTVEIIESFSRVPPTAIVTGVLPRGA